MTRGRVINKVWQCGPRSFRWQIVLSRTGCPRFVKSHEQLMQSWGVPWNCTWWWLKMSGALSRLSGDQVVYLDQELVKSIEWFRQKGPSFPPPARSRTQWGWGWEKGLGHLVNVTSTRIHHAVAADLSGKWTNSSTTCKTSSDSHCFRQLECREVDG